MNSEPRGRLKSRAESFAHHLQAQLKRLSESEDVPWSEVADSEVYYDINSSQLSPQEEIKEPVFIAAQNQDSLNIQRSDSEASTYFDAFQSVEELESFTGVLGRQKKPLRLLNLKTEIPSTITNGQATFFVDEDDLNDCGKSSPSSTGIEVCNGHLECLEMPSLRLELEIIENETENRCDIIGNVVEENNKAGGDIEEIAEFKLSLDKNCDLALVEVDTGQVIAVEVPTGVDPDNGSCVFCDIEQIKTTLSNGWTEHTTLPENSRSVSSSHKYVRSLEEKSSDEGNLPENDSQSCKENHWLEEYEANNLVNNQINVDKGSLTSQDKTQCELSVNVDKGSVISQDKTQCELSVNVDKGSLTSQDKTQCELSVNEENVPLTDLLQVLRNEISNETDKNNDNTKTDQHKSCELQSEGPTIEITVSAPVVEAKSNTTEEEEFDIDMRRKNFRRSSSLKSGKTPPGTPGRKKIVRFADVLGLDLADVKTFQDEVPTVPMSAFQDLQVVEPATITVVAPQCEKVLVPLFQQPCVQPSFLDKVRVNNVCLENAIVSDMSLFAITGVVRVKNMDFHKSVYVRYTINNWQSYSDLQARYTPNSCDGFSDRFTFVLYAHTLNVGQKLQFAVRYHTAGAQFWDSNGGINYTFVCNSTEQSKQFTSSSDEITSFY